MQQKTPQEPAAPVTSGHKILNIKGAIEKSGLPRRTIYQEIQESRFPRPIELTARRVGWIEKEIDDWIAAKIAKRDVAA